MDYHTTPRRRRSSPKDANRRLPADLTTHLVDKLRACLSPSPKTDWLLSELLSKYVSSQTAPSSVRRARAVSKLLGAEMCNEGTNVRLATVDEGFNILPRVTFAEFVGFVQHTIISVLGCEVVPEEIFLMGGFSGGATTSRKRTESHPALKYVGQADITPSARGWFDLFIEAAPLWKEAFQTDSIREVPGNVLFTVPKNAEIDRCACKEPDLNMYMQKAAGNYIRRRLQRFGINLNDQSRNQSLARIGSIDGSLATLDLSSASDSITCGLVSLLLPVHWHGFLDDIRSRVTYIDGDIHVNEMFSNMGNGFTFELQSLLFYSLSRAVAYFEGISGVISVYGDDIIVPTALTPSLIWVLGFFGFQVNEAKSFVDGPFRESCGGHYYSGQDVTPFYIRRPIDSIVEVIHVANSLRRWSQFDGLDILDPEVEDVWLWLASHVPECFWGGVNTHSTAMLVSRHRGDKMRFLSSIQSKPIPTGDGGYLLWHDTVENGCVSGAKVSFRVFDTGAYRSKRYAYGHMVTDFHFPREV